MGQVKPTRVWRDDGESQRDNADQLFYGQSGTVRLIHETEKEKREERKIVIRLIFFGIFNRYTHDPIELFVFQNVEWASSCAVLCIDKLNVDRNSHGKKTPVGKRPRKKMVKGG